MIGTAMDLSEDDVIQIIKYLDESSFSELRLEIGGLKIVVIKRGSQAFIEEADSSAKTQPELTDHSGSLTAQDSPVPPTQPAAQDTPETPPDIEKEIVEDGRFSITSPMLGTFYKAPKPGEPPFVEVGAMVEQDATVCIIEVMKLFSTIKAERRGRIARICAEDGQLVEYRQVLFLLDPPTD